MIYTHRNGCGYLSGIFNRVASIGKDNRYGDG